MMGASVPIYLFDDLFHVPVIGLPITNHDNNQHAANENLRLRNLWDAVNLYAAMMARAELVAIRPGRTAALRWAALDRTAISL